MKFIKLSEIFDNYENIGWSNALYLPKDETLWSLQTKAIIADPDLFEYDEYDKPIAIELKGYEYVLSCDDITAICINYIENHPSYTKNDLLEAFYFYLDNDAFI